MRLDKKILRGVSSREAAVKRTWKYSQRPLRIFLSNLVPQSFFIPLLVPLRGPNKTLDLFLCRLRKADQTRLLIYSFAGSAKRTEQDS